MRDLRTSARRVAMLARYYRIVPQPDSARIEHGVIDVLKNVSRRPIDPTRESELVADLGFDSLQVLEVVSELEDRFSVTIPTDDLPSARTVGDVVDQVAKLVGEQSVG